LTASLWKPRGGRPVWTTSSVREILTNEANEGFAAAPTAPARARR
jgi:hypothetical protein